VSSEGLYTRSQSASFRCPKSGLGAFIIGSGLRVGKVAEKRLQQLHSAIIAASFLPRTMYAGQGPRVVVDDVDDDDDDDDDDGDKIFDGEILNNHGLKVLWFVFSFTLVFSVVELGAGIWAKSLLLIEESVHMFADSVSFGIALWAEIKIHRGSSQKCANLIGSAVSLTTLSVTMVAVLIESIRRLVNLNDHGVIVNSNVMLIFGVILMTFHLLCLLLYTQGFAVHRHGHEASHNHEHEHSHRNHEYCAHSDHHGHSHACCGIEHSSLNMASAFFHIVIDFLHSTFVFLTAIIIRIFGHEKMFAGTIDAIASLFLAFVIGGGVFVLAKQFCAAFRAKNSRTYEVPAEIDLQPMKIS